MKKYLYSLAALSMLLFASCADETYESGIPQSGNAISFQIDTPVTRATPVVKSNIADIYKTMDVTAADADGKNPFPDTNATTFTISNGENNTLVASAISPIRYWPAAGDALNFFVTPSANKACMKDIIYSKPSGSTGGSYSFTFTQPVEGDENNAIQTPDLIVATAYGAEKGKAVDLTFNHALTAVKVYYSKPINSHKIKSINVKDAYTKGVCTVKSDGSFTWSGQSNTATLNQVINHENIYSAGELIGAADESTTFMLIPGGSLDLYVTMIEKDKDGKDIEVNYSLTSNTNVELVAGQTVVINLKDQVKTNDAVPTNKVIESYVENGQTLYKITIDAWVTGTVETETAAVPLDLVVLLDVSGSMTYNYSSSQNTEYVARNSQGYSYNDLNNKEYYYWDGSNYYRVKRDSDRKNQSITNWFGTEYYYLMYTGGDGNSHYLYGNSVTGTKPKDIEKKNSTIWTGVLYEIKSTTTNVTRLEATKTAVNTLIDNIKNNQLEWNATNPDKPVSHRISLVKFSMAENTTIGNNFDSDKYNYSQIVKELSDVVENESALRDAVQSLSANGGTWTDNGLSRAQASLQNARSNASKVIVMLTDGEPTGTGSTWNSDVATNAIKIASSIKGADGKDATIWSIFAARSSDETNQIKTFMKNIATDDDHYKFADNPDALNAIFQTISNSVGATTVDLGSKTTINDTMSNVFELPEGFSAESNVTCYTWDFKGYDGQTPIWENRQLATSVTPKISGKTISVTGFDYSKNACGVDENGQNAMGQKLQIVISGLKLDPKYEGGDLTNMAGSGVYDKDGNLISEFAPNSLPSSGTTD